MSETAKAIVGQFYESPYKTTQCRHDIEQAIDAALDAAVRAERERCIEVLRDVQRDYDSRGVKWIADAIGIGMEAIRHQPSPDARGEQE